MKNLREKFIQFTRSSTAMLFMFIIIVIIILAIFFCGFTTSAHSCWEVMDSISLKRMYRKSFSPLIQFSFSFCPSKFSHFNHGGLITVNRKFYTILLYSKGWKRRSHNYKRMGEAGTINTIVFFEVFFISSWRWLWYAPYRWHWVRSGIFWFIPSEAKREDYGDVVKFQWLPLHRSSPLLRPFPHYPGRTQDLMISESRIANYSPRNVG